MHTIAFISLLQVRFDRVALCAVQYILAYAVVKLGGKALMRRGVHNPSDADRRFRFMPSTCSEPCRPAVPTDGVQFFLDVGSGGRLGSESVDGMLWNPVEQD